MDAIKVARVDRVILRSSGGQSTGTLHLTAHHIIFIEDNDTKEEKWVPYPLISLVTRLPQTLQGTTPMLFRCRDFDSFCFYFAKEDTATDVFESVKELTVAPSISSLYAFFYEPNPPFDVSDGWTLFNPREEFARMGVGSRTKAWRFTDINKDYTFCPTYAARLVVPARISDTVLMHAAKYRSKARIPALTYLHWANYATITRSSQPMVGLTNSRSIQDEKLIEAIFQSHLNPSSPFGSDVKPKVGPIQVYGATATNLIIDARPTTNAMANVAKGAGTEKMENYKEGKKAYLGIDNIHVMRDSLAKVVEALREADALTSTLGLSGPSASGTVFLDRQALRRSGWLKHLSAIIDGAVLIVKNVHINSSHVLVHCSDGWDRTGQLASLAELCLDPFYRTFRGFQVLVEKDWLAFGHRFADRCGHLSSEKFFISTSGDAGPGAGGSDAAQAFFASVQKQFASQGHLKEMSPVFHQFLECVRQIQRQFPNRFEFNELFLRKLYYHLYSCQFGSFLFNSEKERRTGSPAERPPWERTSSAWDFFNDTRSRSEYLNPFYDPILDDALLRTSGADMGVLLPEPRNVRFWNELYGREDQEMNGRIVTAQAVGAEFLGLVEDSREDPVLPDEGIEEASASCSSSSLSHRILESPTVSRTPTPSNLPRTETPASLDQQPDSQPHLDTFRAFPTETSLFSMHTEPRPGSTPDLDNRLSEVSSPPRSVTPKLPLQPRRQTQDVFADAPVNAVRSMWASVSSGGRAAFSAVQGAYGEVAKEIRGIAAQGGPPSSRRSDQRPWPEDSDELMDRQDGQFPSRRSTIDVGKITDAIPRMDLTGNPWTESSTQKSVPIDIQRRAEPTLSPTWSGSSDLPHDPTISIPPSVQRNMSYSPTRPGGSTPSLISPIHSTNMSVSTSSGALTSSALGTPTTDFQPLTNAKMAPDTLPPETRNTDPLGVGFLS